jgi:hypothetical protein
MHMSVGESKGPWLPKHIDWEKRAKERRPHGYAHTQTNRQTGNTIYTHVVPSMLGAPRECLRKST